MDIKTSAHYQRAYRRRLRDQGLVKKEVWIRPEHAKELSAVEKRLRLADATAKDFGGNGMQQLSSSWNTLALHEALMKTPSVASGAIQLELIEGSDPVLHLAMTEFGDLPMFLTVSGEQILIECMLWPVSCVLDKHAFNEAVLKTHKYFPLSTISLEPTLQGEDAYYMFGALSDGAPLGDVLVEIETLANNVLQATEAYEDFLVTYEQEVLS
jgi:uncharacterized protein YjfI (DUF2170 family)